MLENKQNLIAKEYNLLYLDTSGKIYRFIGALKLKKKNLIINLLKKKLKILKLKELKNKKLY